MKIENLLRAKIKDLEQELALKNRELEIEAALERVRVETMAMKTSEEIGRIIYRVYSEIKNLGVVHHLAQIITDFELNKGWFNTWYGFDEKEFAHVVRYNFFDHPFNGKWKAALKYGHSFYIDSYSKREKDAWLDGAFRFSDLSFISEERKNHLYQTSGLSRIVSLEKNSSLSLMKYNNDEFSAEDKNIVIRFGALFEQSYTRFLDLKKAEAQEREAQIEAALEKVRSRSLAMHRSDELQEIITSVLYRLSELGLSMDTAVVVLPSEEKQELMCWVATNDFSYSQGFRIPFGLNSVIRIDSERFHRSGSDYFAKQYSKQEKDEYYKDLIEHTDFKHIPQDRKDFLFSTDEYGISIASNKNSGIQTISYSGKILNETEAEVLRRFSRVFEQAYVRFLDLQKAEAQAREAIKRASVDRIRAEIASMRTKGDLERIQPLIWNELKILSVPFIRCGVFIMDEVKQDVQVFLSTPDGKSIAAFRLPYYATEQSKQIVTHWQKKHLYKDYMDEAAFAAYTKNLVQQGAMTGNEKYVTENRPTDLSLHFLPFLQGMLYVGNDAPLKEDELQLVQNLADAFSTAYARYEDFHKLELAKSEVESAMTELKATQSQLVQQEKLASLGQLTAGIAHEIKNPLNFVNNFSEVSIELIEEALEEITQIEDNEHARESAEILSDIKSNLKKIHEHGTRANGIVTSMLQHSRGGSGKKEATDLNALIKEYVNLSFHGMRAGKNPINVDIQLDLDPEIKEVPLINEDFTRVIINLCNNAFDALKTVKTQREASLRVRTKKHLDTITIKIEDNGPGIPDGIKDKILLPFFTTKKGTEGTGLGLSITHDIVKAHGGELTLASNEEIGTQFTIKIPIA